ncbi:hypothetical protein [Flavobacterium sp.]|uniref:hypothetical protein n=1 Tax=Flavobacterium sp. TaxID=239 RepID=UPI003752CEDD
MKKRIAFTFLLLISFNIIKSQEIKRDIEDIYLKKLLIEKDSTSQEKFQNFAINLFLNGTRLNDSILKNHDKNFVGVCLKAEVDSLKIRKIEFNIYALSYKDNREKNFHKKLYFSGFEGIANFYVICYNE